MKGGSCGTFCSSAGAGWDANPLCSSWLKHGPARGPLSTVLATTLLMLSMVTQAAGNGLSPGKPMLDKVILGNSFSRLHTTASRDHHCICARNMHLLCRKCVEPLSRICSQSTSAKLDTDLSLVQMTCDFCLYRKYGHGSSAHVVGALAGL